MKKPMRYCAQVCCFETIDFSIIDDRQTLLFTSHIECHLGSDMSQPFALTGSGQKFGLEVSKVDR